MSVVNLSNLYHTINNGTTSWNTAEDYSDASKWWLEFKEFENTMPDIHRLKEMCAEYPALDKAFENFKMVYNLVKDDYEAKHKDG